MTCRSAPSATTTAVRTSWPLRTNAWSCSASPTRMRCHANRSASHRPPETQSNELVKWSASRSRNSSGDADAVAGEREDRVLLRVGGHDVRVVAREVRGGEVAAELRRDVEVVDLVPGGVARDLHDAHLRLAVLVRAEDDGGLGHGSAPSIGGIGERAQEQRGVHVASVVGDEHGEHDLGVERVDAARGEVRAGVEPQPVLPRRQLVGSQLRDPAVGVGAFRRERRPRVTVARVQLDRDARGAGGPCRRRARAW